MNDGVQEDVVEWSRDTQKIAVLSWLSFLSACGFSVLLFAYIDPLVIVDAINVSFIESANDTLMASTMTRGSM